MPLQMRPTSTNTNGMAVDKRTADSSRAVALPRLALVVGGSRHNIVVGPWRIVAVVRGRARIERCVRAGIPEGNLCLGRLRDPQQSRQQYNCRRQNPHVRFHFSSSFPVFIQCYAPWIRPDNDPFGGRGVPRIGKCWSTALPESGRKNRLTAGLQQRISNREKIVSGDDGNVACR